MDSVVSRLSAKLQEVRTTFPRCRFAILVRIALCTQVNNAFEDAKEEAADASLWQLIGAVIKAVIDIVIMVVAPEFSAAEMAIGCAIDAGVGAAGDAVSSSLSAPDSPYGAAVTDQLQGNDAHVAGLSPPGYLIHVTCAQVSTSLVM